jgi:hypothetical protein
MFMTPGREWKYPSRKLVIRVDDQLGIPFFPASNFGCCLQTLMSQAADGLAVDIFFTTEPIDFKLDKRDGTATMQTGPAMVQAPITRAIARRLRGEQMGRRSTVAGTCGQALPGISLQHYSCALVRFKYLPVPLYFVGSPCGKYLSDASRNDI